MTRVVITGMGVVSPLGHGVDRLWAALCNGDDGIGSISRFDTTGFAFQQAGQINQMPPLPASIQAEQLDPANHFVLAAVDQAVNAAQLNVEPAIAADTGVVLSTNFGSSAAGERFLAAAAEGEKGTAVDFGALSFQHCAELVKNQYGLGRLGTVLSLSCTSGTAALGYGFDMIRAGHAKAIITGGYDALSRFAWSGLSVLRTMTKDKVRPFDKNRAGTIFSEGAGAIVVEDLAHAKARGATILAEVLGHALNNNAYHMTAPAKEGAGTAAVMAAALQDAGLEPDSIDHINAHGTGTKHNDVTETQAIKTVFGEHAYRIPITSIKSMLGHTMGATGSLEAIASVMSIRNNVIPPTTNFEEPDPECDLDYVTNEKRETEMKIVLSNSAGIGGCNAAVILGEAEK